MTALALIDRDPESSARTGRNWNRLRESRFVVTDLGIYVNTDGQLAIRLVSGGGLTQSASGLSVTVPAYARSISSVAVNTNAGSTAYTDYVYFVSGTTTITLPTAVSNTNRYTIKNSGVATVTIATTSSQTIDGSSTASLPVANTSLDLISDGSNWRVV